MASASGSAKKALKRQIETMSEEEAERAVIVFAPPWPPEALAEFQSPAGIGDGGAAGTPSGKAQHRSARTPQGKRVERRRR